MGIVHNLMPFEARKGRYGLFVWWTRVVARVCNVCWGNDVILDYLGTGQLNWAPLAPIPLGGTSYTDPQGRPPMDWIGLNFYSRCPLRWPLLRPAQSTPLQCPGTDSECLPSRITAFRGTAQQLCPVLE